MADLHEAAALGAMERVVFDRVHRSALTDEELASAIDAALQVSEISPKAAVYGAWHRLLVLLAEVNTGRQPDAAWQWEGPRGQTRRMGCRRRRSEASSVSRPRSLSRTTLPNIVEHLRHRGERRCKGAQRLRDPPGRFQRRWPDRWTS